MGGGFRGMVIPAYPVSMGCELTSLGPTIIRESFVLTRGFNVPQRRRRNQVLNVGLRGPVGLRAIRKENLITVMDGFAP